MWWACLNKFCVGRCFWLSAHSTCDKMLKYAPAFRGLPPYLTLLRQRFPNWSPPPLIAVWQLSKVGNMYALGNISHDWFNRSVIASPFEKTKFFLSNSLSLVQVFYQGSTFHLVGPCYLLTRFLWWVCLCSLQTSIVAGSDQTTDCFACLFCHYKGAGNSDSDLMKKASIDENLDP